MYASVIGKNKNKMTMKDKYYCNFDMRFLINFGISNINKFDIHNLVLSGLNLPNIKSMDTKKL